VDWLRLRLWYYCWWMLLEIEKSEPEKKECSDFVQLSICLNFSSMAEYMHVSNTMFFGWFTVQQGFTY
jgi:hypothetical protein